MTILDKAQIGNEVKVNLELSKDRLNREIIDAINISDIGIISDFRITDGKGIGVILKLSNGKEQWFFENEIDFLDENGNVLERNIESIDNNKLILNIFKDFKYKNKKNIRDLINPINFMMWLIFAIKDNF